jgi:hypothetical protein
MQGITLSAAGTSIATVICMVIVPIAANAPDRPQVRPSTAAVNTHFSIPRDDRRSEARPCLLGLRSCMSLYPPPIPCLVSTTRCEAEGHFEFAAQSSAVFFDRR